jgi:uncharacterized membrane protein YfhO
LSDKVSVVEKLNTKFNTDDIIVHDEIKSVVSSGKDSSTNHCTLQKAIINAKDFHYKGTDSNNKRVNVYTAELPLSFPKYLTTNMLNQDYKCIKVSDTNGNLYAPTYFDLFSESQRFQIGFEENRGIDIALKNIPPDYIQVEWMDYLMDEGIEIVNYTNNTISMKTAQEKDRFLVLMDRNSPRWNIAMDGNSCDIFTANGSFKGFIVPKGKHFIKLAYKNILLKMAIILYTLSTYISVLLIAALLYIRNRHGNRIQYKTSIS